MYSFLGRKESTIAWPFSTQQPQCIIINIVIIIIIIIIIDTKRILRCVFSPHCATNIMDDDDDDDGDDVDVCCCVQLAHQRVEKVEEVLDKDGTNNYPK